MLAVAVSLRYERGKMKVTFERLRRRCNKSTGYCIWHVYLVRSNGIIVILPFIVSSNC